MQADSINRQLEFHLRPYSKKLKEVVHLLIDCRSPLNFHEEELRGFIKILEKIDISDVGVHFCISIHKKIEYIFKESVPLYVQTLLEIIEKLKEK